MTEASLFYETASGGLGREFLDEVQRVIDTVREHPKLGSLAGRGSGKRRSSGSRTG